MDPPGVTEPASGVGVKATAVQRFEGTGEGGRFEAGKPIAFDVEDGVLAGVGVGPHGEARALIGPAQQPAHGAGVSGGGQGGHAARPHEAVDAVVTGSPRICSGLAYSGVSSCMLVRVSAPVAAAWGSRAVRSSASRSMARW